MRVSRMEQQGVPGAVLAQLSMLVIGNNEVEAALSFVQSITM